MLLSFVECLVILTVTVMTELCGLNIRSRSRGRSSFPEAISSGLRKDSASVALAVGQHILAISVDGISLDVAGRAWTLFGSIEALGSRVDD
jgi:hypothetical protein